jgi:hypothetical protein
VITLDDVAAMAMELPEVTEGPELGPPHVVGA